MVSRRKTKKGSTEAKLLGALIAALLFFIVSEKRVYALTNTLFGKFMNGKFKTATQTSCKLGSGGDTSSCSPTIFGEVLHSVVFGLLVLLIMEI
jgi:hypothetical protein